MHLKVLPINALGKNMSTKGTKHFPTFYLHFTYKYQQCREYQKSSADEQGLIEPLSEQLFCFVFCLILDLGTKSPDGGLHRKYQMKDKINFKKPQ